MTGSVTGSTDGDSGVSSGSGESSAGGSSVGGTMVSAPPTDAASGCWVWVDEDWKPSTGMVVIGGQPIGAPMAPERMTPFNRVMGEGKQDDYSPPRIVNVDYANLCRGVAVLSTPVRDVEALRLKNELYLGEGGRYAFSNRAVLEKRVVRALPELASAELDKLLAIGSITLAPISIAKGYRWMDKGGQWIDYNTQGQIVAYGDRNDNIVWLTRDTNGALRGVVDANGRIMYTLHYMNGLLVEVRDYPIAGMTRDLPARSVKYEYDIADRLTAVIDVRGNTTRYGYDTDNRIVSITDQEGRIEKLAYTGTSVTKRTAPDGGTTDYVFDYDDVNKQFNSRITGPETAAGRKVEDYIHNRPGKLVRFSVNGRVDAEIRYDSGAQSELVTNARGFKRRSVKNEFDQVVQQDFEDGTTERLHYSALNLRLLDLVDGAGNKTEFSYDKKGNMIRSIEAAGSDDHIVTDYEVNRYGLISKKTIRGRNEHDGSVSSDAITNFEYDPQGQVKSITDPQGNVRRAEFNRIGNLVSRIDSRGHQITVDFDMQGQPLKTVDALGQIWEKAYDRTGNLIGSRDPKSNEVKYSYDALNRQVEQRYSDKVISKTTYSPQGNPTSFIDPDGRNVQWEYDNFSRITKQKDGAGNTISYAYEIADGTTSGILGSLNQATEIIYPTYTERKRFDQLERTTSINFFDAKGTLVSNAFGYGRGGQLETETDAYGEKRKYEFDRLYRLRSSIDKLGNKTHSLYDVRGNLIQIKDANGNVRKYEYDLNNRVIKEIWPLGQVISTVYDTEGNVSSRTDPNGNKSVFTYDAANRIINIKQYSKPDILEKSVAYVWSATDQLVSWETEEHGVISKGVMTHDEMDRVTGETIVYPGGFSMNYAYSYSAAGRKVALLFPDRTSINYGYSEHGELASISIPGEGVIGVNKFNWNYPETITFPGGVIQNRRYDGLMKLKQLEVVNSRKEVLYNAENEYGKLQETITTSQTDFLSNSPSVTKYTYDKETRLSQVVNNVGNNSEVQVFSLDPLDNRLNYNQLPGKWIYDSNNRLISRGEGADGTSYKYDAAGNLIQKIEGLGKAIQYFYNSENRLIRVENQAGLLIAKYGYDALSRRIWKEQYRAPDGSQLAKAVRTYYLYSEEGLIAEAMQPLTLNADSSVTLEDQPILISQYGLRPDSDFTTAPLFIKTKNSNDKEVVGYYHHDHRGAPIRATDRFGNIVWAAKYDAFGAAQIITPLATLGLPTITSNLRLPGQIEDAETGLHYNYVRDYDPEIGRYITSDPIGVEGGLNTYAYVNGNPVDMIDPTGEIGLVGAAIGAGIDLAIQVLIEDKQFACIDWMRTGMAGAAGAVGGGIWSGAFRHAKSGKSWMSLSQKWKNVSPRVRKAQNTPKGEELHHWLIERNSAIGKRVPESIKNHPWNLNPVSESFHIQLHKLDPISRTVIGAPGWAKSAGASGIAGGAAEAASPNVCGC